MDLIDRKILDLLQRDATLAIAEVADRVGLSQTPCWKRIQRLEAQGVIQRRVALLDPEKLGLGLTVFVSVESGDHSQEWLTRFADLVSGMPEVLEFHRMAGEVDYMLRVVVPDMRAYDGFYKRLIGAVPLKNVTSRFSMERIKSTTVLPSPRHRRRPRRRGRFRFSGGRAGSKRSPKHAKIAKAFQLTAVAFDPILFGIRSLQRSSCYGVSERSACFVRP